MRRVGDGLFWAHLSTSMVIRLNADHSGTSELNQMKVAAALEVAGLGSTLLLGRF